MVFGVQFGFNYLPLRGCSVFSLVIIIGFAQGVQLFRFSFFPYGSVLFPAACQASLQGGAFPVSGSSGGPEPKQGPGVPRIVRRVPAPWARWPPRAPTPLGTQGNHPPGKHPAGIHPPGESSPRGIIPLGHIPLGYTPLGSRPPGESSPWGNIPLGNRLPKESFPLGITALGNHTPKPVLCEIELCSKSWVSKVRVSVRPGYGGLDLPTRPSRRTSTTRRRV